MPSSLSTLQTTMIDLQTGMLTWSGLKLLQQWQQQLAGGFDANGNLISNISLYVGLVGRGGTFATILGNISDAGVVTALGIDFAQAYLHKDTDHITDGTGFPLAGGKKAYAALVASFPSASKFLQFDGVNWVPHTLVFPDVSGLVSTAQLPATGVTVGSYTNANITVDATGRVLSAVSGSTSGINFSDNETVAGTGTAWTLAHTPSPVASLELFAYIAGFGGVLLRPGGVDYTLAGLAVTTVSAYAAGGLTAWYRY